MLLPPVTMRRGVACAALKAQLSACETAWLICAGDTLDNVPTGLICTLHRAAEPCCQVADTSGQA